MKNLTCFKIAAAAMLAAATSFGATTMRAGNAGGQEIPVSGPYSTMRFVWRQVKNGGERKSGAFGQSEHAGVELWQGRITKNTK